MEEIKPSTGADPSDRPLRRVLVITGLVLAALIVIAALIYAGAFLMLAPMMQ
ncbi:MAG TPA: hypothetical protein VIQ11_13710 [Mycobacterium sp.]|nr:hypothetical protein [Dietzia sp.]